LPLDSFRACRLFPSLQRETFRAAQRAKPAGDCAKISYVPPMLASAVILLLLSGYFELPSISSTSFSMPAPLLAARFPTTLDSVGSFDRDAFTSLLEAFHSWDAAVGCPRIRAKLAAATAGRSG
jgi:alpha-1,4-fucosyltransferase